MEARLTGGCMCGAVRYECSATPALAVNCHCRDCQRVTGSAYSPMLFVPHSAVTITGKVQYYDVKGESGNRVRRGFCPTCGARLLGQPVVLPDLVGIRVGSLDDPSGYQPEMDVYTASAQPWDYMNPEVPKFPK